MSLFENDVNIDNITVMIQKEVAERIVSKPGTKDYGALTLAVNFYSTPEIVANVPPNCFMPRPNVSSAVIRMTKDVEPKVKVADKELLFKLIKASFLQRRKTLVNGIGNFKELNITKDRVAEALKEMGLDENIRGERLSLSEFGELSDLLSEK